MSSGKSFTDSALVPNRLGIHALVWVGGWSHSECRTAISSSAAAGYDIIEIPALDPYSIDVSHTKSVLSEFGMRATVSLGLSFDADINSEKLDVVKRGEKKLFSALEIVEKLGGDYLGGVIYSTLGRYMRPPTGLERENAVSSLRKLARAANAKGVTLGLEPVNRYESNLVNTAQQALDMIRDIGEPNVVVHLDIYHMNIEEQDLVSPVMACGDKLGYVHIGASHRGALGTGNIDFNAFFGALAKIQYKGIITFESFSSKVVHPDLSSTLCIWRDLWTDNRKLARDARAFIVEKITMAQKKG